MKDITNHLKGAKKMSNFVYALLYMTRHVFVNCFSNKNDEVDTDMSSLVRENIKKVKYVAIPIFHVEVQDKE